MKKIILSVAAATMAFSTSAAALEDIKVNGQAKVWYETNNQDKNELFSKNTTATTAGSFGTSGEVVFKLGMTGKQGNVGFGATVYQTSTMGLETTLVAGARTNTNGVTAGNGEMFTGEMYVTVPVGAKTLLKVGKQELDTPLAFTERWNAVPNTFNAAVAINNSIDNLTLIGAYVGQDNATTWRVNGEVTQNYLNTSVYAAAALYKAGGITANLWFYDLNSIANAYWLDVAGSVAGVNLKAYAAYINPNNGSNNETKAYALSASTKVSGVNLFGAVSKVNDQAGVAVANTSTGGKKTKLPTAGVYTDGVYVAQAGSKAIKLKASGKLGTTGLALQFVDNSNGIAASTALETSEIDLIISQKVGDVNLKAILMDRSFDNNTIDSNIGAQHVRVIASVNF